MSGDAWQLSSGTIVHLLRSVDSIPLHNFIADSFQVIDFGASRDGIPEHKRGYREVVELDRQNHLDDDRIEELDDS